MCMAGILWDALDNGLWKAVWTLWMVRRTQTRLPRTLSAQIATYCRTTGCHMSERWFPIMGAPAIPWSMIEPCEKQAQLNHDQSLERLAERGGLAPCEALRRSSSVAWTSRCTRRSRCLSSVGRICEGLSPLPDESIRHMSMLTYWPRCGVWRKSNGQSGARTTQANSAHA